jgi:hypothetical protein
MNNNVIQTPAMEETKATNPHVRLLCPNCLNDGGLTIYVDAYDFGSESGYSDAGEVATFVCKCGCTGDVEGDLIREAY